MCLDAAGPASTATAESASPDQAETVINTIILCLYRYSVSLFRPSTVCIFVRLAGRFWCNRISRNPLHAFLSSYSIQSPSRFLISASHVACHVLPGLHGPWGLHSWQQGGHASGALRAPLRAQGCRAAGSRCVCAARLSAWCSRTGRTGQQQQQVLAAFFPAPWGTHQPTANVFTVC